MVLLRRVIGDALRARRQGQHRTLREVSTAANVSLGYLSEIERGQKEASSELLAAICEALGARLSEVLRRGQRHARRWPSSMDGRAGAGRRSAVPAAEARHGARSRQVDARTANVSVSVRQESPLKTTLRATRKSRATSSTPPDASPIDLRPLRGGPAVSRIGCVASGCLAGSDPVAA